jgi:hypothetical protein
VISPTFSGGGMLGHPDLELAGVGSRYGQVRAARQRRGRRLGREGEQAVAQVGWDPFSRAEEEQPEA